MLRKLDILGVRGTANRIIEEYLFGRKQRVQSEENHSNFQYVKHSVLQGSALSSLLFLIYVNDCLEIPLEGQIQMYADDTILIYSCNNPQQLHQHIQNDLIKINNWMYNNDMSFNATKTKYILFKKDKIYHSINGTEIQQTPQAKYLGLIIDENLSWKPHLQYLLRKY